MGTEDFAESTKSGAQIIFAALCLCALSVRRGTLIDHEAFSLLIGRLMTLHALLLIAQCIVLNVLGSMALQNPFGPFSAIGPAGALGALPAPYLPYDDGVMRPNGFYSEPSVAAAYTVFALACVLSSQLPAARKMISSAILATGAFATFALTGWVMLAAVLVCSIVFASRTMTATRRLGLYVLALVAAFGAASVGGFYLVDRLEGAGEFGGSIYMRFIGPLRLVRDVLGNDLLGLPLNDPTFLLARDYLVDFAGRQFFVLDNFYVWIGVYFGLPGIGLIAWCLFRLLRALRQRGRLALPMLSMALFAAATGSGYNSVFVLPLTIALSMVRSGEGAAHPARRLVPQLAVAMAAT